MNDRLLRDRRDALVLGGAIGVGLVAAACGGQGRDAESPQARGGEEEISPAEDLMREHGVLNRVLLIYEEGIRRLEAPGEKVPVDQFAATANIVRRFIEDYHGKLEEDFLFPRFDKAGKLVELVAILRRQHEAGRKLTDEVLRQVGSPVSTEDARRQLAGNLRKFIRMYRPHEAREDTVLFPALPNRHSAEGAGGTGRALRGKGARSLREGRLRGNRRPGCRHRSAARHRRPCLLHAVMTSLRAWAFDARGPRATALLRGMVGIIFVSEGIQKFVFPEELGVGRFTKIGIPMPSVTAPFVGCVETLGGCLLILGFATRLICIPLLLNMLVAITTTKLATFAKNGFWKTMHEARTDLLMISGVFFVLLVGAGSLSMDGWVDKSRRSSDG